jgi:hypothetical protein
MGNVSNLKILEYDPDVFDSGGLSCMWSNKYNFKMTPRKLYANDGGYVQECTWWSLAAAHATSDIRFKNDIVDLPIELNDFFDNIKPRQFKFNEDALKGDPNKVHFGFIAQEIQEELQKVNVENAFLLDSTHKDMLTLGYSEFIALNTWQIQKAKARISELEEKVAKLEKLINDK